MMPNIDNGGLAILFIPFIVTLLGFYNFLYFITIGYGLSMTFIGISLLVFYCNILNTVTKTLCMFLIVYGVRLNSYLIIREFCSKSYKATVKNDINRINSYSKFINILSWISCSLLYTSLSTPVYYIIINGGKKLLSSYICIGIIFFGFALEIIADHQKTVAKKKDPRRFVDNGLYRFVRCPNYFGEIVFWTGVFISGFNIYNSYQFWIFSILGYIGIIYVMFSGARRLEIRQNKTYGNDAEYQNYFNNTPMIFPCIPLYSVEKYTWFVA